jgi:chromosome segregation ATPase
MSNMKVVALINEAEKREAAKADAIAQDLYAALEPLRDAIASAAQRIATLEREVEELKRHLTGDGR